MKKTAPSTGFLAVPRFFASLREATNGKPMIEQLEAKNALRSLPDLRSLGEVGGEVEPHRYSANSFWAKHSVQMHYAYILQSISHPERFYYGSTADLKKRLAVHNDGGNVSTNPYRPWALAWYSGFPCKQTAANFERYVKTASGKAYARKRVISES